MDPLKHYTFKKWGKFLERNGHTIVCRDIRSKGGVRLDRHGMLIVRSGLRGSTDLFF